MANLTRRFATFFSLSIFLLVVVPACDPVPDLCSDSDDSCDGDSMDVCFRPGLEAHSRMTHIDCPTGGTCAIRGGAAMCIAKAPDADCDDLSATVCSSGNVARCSTVETGKKTWVPFECEKGCSWEATQNAYCTY